MKKKQSFFHFSDFGGGYFTNVPSELLKDNELLTAEECQWENGLTKRQGRAFVASVAGSTVQGGIRAKMLGSWYTILAIDTGGAVEIRAGTGTTFATVPYPDATAHTLTTAKSLQFAYMGEHVVAVNGTDDPRVLYEHSGTIVMDTLERFDTRTRDTDNWYAGSYAASTPTYTDDTTDAQDAGSTDFAVIASQSGHGCYVACDLTFNKLVFTDCGVGSAASPEYQYYGRASNSGAIGWQTWTAIVEPATWGGSAGDRTVEFNIPLDANDGTLLMEPYDSDEGDLTNRYCFRLNPLVGASAGINCAQVQVYHTQYLSELCLGDVPDTVAEHKSHIFLGMGNWMRISPRNYLTGWRGQDYEWFKDGGKILAMVSHMDYMAILMETAIYGLGGNSWADWVLRYLGPGGIVSKRGAGVCNELVYFVGADGVYQWTGKNRIKVSKHVQSDIDSWTLTDAVIGVYKGRVWVNFPTNGKTLVFDPDTFRWDEEGDGRVSLYKYMYGYPLVLPYTGEGDTGYLYGLYNASGANIRMDRLETAGHLDDITSTAVITMKAQTKYFDGGNSFVDKITRRIKARISDVSATGGMNYTFKTYSLHEKGRASYSQVIAASALASGIHIGEITPPHTLDGKNLSVYMEHAGSTTAVLYGLAMDMETRRY